MNKKIIKLAAVLLVGHLFIFPQLVHAVIPPDFIFNIGTQIAQFFSLIVIFFTAVFGAFFQFFRTKYLALKHRRMALGLSVVSVIGISLISSYFYAIHEQRAQYEEWLEESRRHALNQNVVENRQDGESNDIDGTNPVAVASLADSRSSVNAAPQESDFFSKNEKQNIFITNQDFRNVTEGGGSDYVVLDAREDIEYENGYFPGSLHIRFADIKSGRWAELPQDKLVYVICWSGIRGKEVAEFLRTNKIVASYLENGANGWVEFGGKWVGSIKFGEKYTDSKYQIVFSTEDVKSKVADGAVLVDSREPYKFQKFHITGSFNIPILYTATADLDKAFSQVPPNSKVIAVCDGYVNCFDAKITGVELERRGYDFLGRYNKSWEYEK